MPRSPRLDLPGIAQHVGQRGNDRQPCFFTDIDYVRYLQGLREIALREGCLVHAYALMTNHVHLLVTPAETGRTGRLMQALGRRYVRYVNDRYHRTGTLWEGRYKACLVGDDRYLLRCHRYIELNPVRARMWPIPQITRGPVTAIMPSAAPIPSSRPTPPSCVSPPTRNAAGTTTDAS